MPRIMVPDGRGGWTMLELPYGPEGETQMAPQVARQPEIQMPRHDVYRPQLSLGDVQRPISLELGEARLGDRYFDADFGRRPSLELGEARLEGPEHDQRRLLDRRDTLMRSIAERAAERSRMGRSAPTRIQYGDTVVEPPSEEDSRRALEVEEMLRLRAIAGKRR